MEIKHNRVKTQANAKEREMNYLDEHENEAADSLA
jgi:hypothetical protein